MLNIKRIQIKNFRQYKDLDLKLENKTGLYLFIGKNGMGKSNFLNAICWCLYEAQPFTHHDSGKTILNDDAAEENENEEIKVVLDVEMDGTIYRFQRTLQNTQSSRLKVFIKQGENFPEVPNPNVIVNSFMPKEISKFFFFDGESVQNLFIGDYANNLKDAIWKVSNVELLENALEHLNIFSNELRKEVSRDEPETKELEGKIQINENEIEALEKKVFQTNNDIVLLKDKKLKLNEKLKLYSKYEVLIAKRLSLEENIVQSEEKINEVDKRIEQILVSFGPFIYIKDALLNVSKQIYESKNKGEIPPKIKDSFLQELIERRICICGQKLTEGEEHYKNILKLKDEISIADENSYLIDDSYSINSKIKELSGLSAQWAELRKTKAEEKSNLAKFQLELKDLSNQLKNADEEEVGNLEQTIQTVDDQLSNASVDFGISKNKLEELKKYTGELREQLGKLNKKKNEKETELKMLDFINQSKDKTGEIRDKLIRQVRQVVSLNTDKYFKEMIWEKDKFEKVEFSDDYNVSVYKNNNLKIDRLEDLSTGELKVLGFATIKSLAKISGFQENPTIVDAPLEYLDQEVQGNFINLLPNFMPNKQLFIFSVDRPAIIDFGHLHIKPENFFRLQRTDNTKNTIINKYKD